MSVLAVQRPWRLRLEPDTLVRVDWQFPCRKTRVLDTRESDTKFWRV
jgi:hypothetical protein